MESATATSPWLPPGGSCHDEISASRNRYFVVTDEGWRWLKVSDFHVGWRKPGHIPSIQLHSFTNRSLPLISLFWQSVPKCRLPKNPASPRGKPRGRSHTLLPFIQPLSFVGFGRILSAPTSIYHLKIYYWIKMFKTGSCVVRSKMPINALLGCVSSGMPCRKAFVKIINGRDPYIQ